MSASSPSFTVLGARGFIGSALVDALETQGRDVHAVTRASFYPLLAARRPVGHVIDCVGLTADFRTRPLETAHAHVGLVARCLAELQFESFLLLSSTRVYAHAASTREDAPLLCQPCDPSHLYNLTKLAGEALCFADGRQTVRVARLSNVYGVGMSSDNFLGQILEDGRRHERVLLHTSAFSEKDYVSLSAVVRFLPEIAMSGRARLYNLAAGQNTTHSTIAERLRNLTGWWVGFAPSAPTIRFPRIDTSRLDDEFGPTLSKLSNDLPTLLGLKPEIPCSPSMRNMAASWSRMPMAR